jgi:hypothetical protein
MSVSTLVPAPDRDDLLASALRAASPGLTKDAVTRSYLGGSSDHWRRFLLSLAQSPEQWLSWSALCEATGRSDRQCRDIVRRAERRCGGQPPYVRASRTGSFDGGSNDYWISAEVAKLIRSLASPRQAIGSTPAGLPLRPGTIRNTHPLAS